MDTIMEDKCASDYLLLSRGLSRLSFAQTDKDIHDDGQVVITNTKNLGFESAEVQTRQLLVWVDDYQKRREKSNYTNAPQAISSSLRIQLNAVVQAIGAALYNEGAKRKLIV